MKTCYKCLREFPLGGFYKNPKLNDGYSGKCKICTRKYSTKYNAKRVYKPKNRSEEERIKIRAHRAVYYAIKTGKIIRGICQKCGTDQNIHAHHEDYNKQLEISWLCHEHHMARHQEIDPKYLKGK